MRPCVVSASKSGAVSLILKAIAASNRKTSSQRVSPLLYWHFGAAIQAPSWAVIDRLVMPDHFLDDEREELLGKIGIEPGFPGKRPQPGHLLCLADGIGRRKALRRFELPYRLCAFEPLGQQVHERRIDIVDGIAQALKVGMRARRHAFPCLFYETLGGRMRTRNHGASLRDLLSTLRRVFPAARACARPLAYLPR